MPIEYEIDSGVIWMRTVGEVDYQSGRKVLDAAIADAHALASPRKLPIVFDIRASRENRSADEARGIAQFVSLHLDVFDRRCAVVAGSDLLFGVARMFGSYAETYGVEVSVFRSIEEVNDWLRAVLAPEA